MPDKIGLVGQSANHFIKAWALSIFITYQLKIWKKSNKIKKHKLKKEFNDCNEQKEKLMIGEIDEIEKQRKNIKKQKPKISSKPVPKPKPK